MIRVSSIILWEHQESQPADRDTICIVKEHHFTTAQIDVHQLVRDMFSERADLEAVTSGSHLGSRITLPTHKVFPALELLKTKSITFADHLNLEAYLLRDPKVCMQ